MVQFSAADCGRGRVHCPSLAPVAASYKNIDFVTGGSVASHSGAAPPPGSQPRTMTLPSQVVEAECQRPRWPSTPGSVIVYRNCGSSIEPPRGAPTLNTFVVSALAQAARLTSTRITQASWQQVRTDRSAG